MTAKASKTRKAGKLKVVGHIGTPAQVVDLLSEALVRAQDDETLAIAIIEVRRGGEIDSHRVGDEYGFAHHLFAGAGYLMRDLGEAE